MFQDEHGQTWSSRETRAVKKISRKGWSPNLIFQVLSSWGRVQVHDIGHDFLSTLASTSTEALDLRVEYCNASWAALKRNEVKEAGNCKS